MQLVVMRARPGERGAQLGIEREDARPDGVRVDAAERLAENRDVDGVRARTACSSPDAVSCSAAKSRTAWGIV